MKTPKIEKYAEAPYKQGYDQALANQKYSNPYLKTEGQEADADDFLRGYSNCKEELVGDLADE